MYVYVCVGKESLPILYERDRLAFNEFPHNTGGVTGRIPPTSYLPNTYLPPSYLFVLRIGEF